MMNEGIFNLIPLIVGSLFFAIGANIVLYVRQFRKKATRLQGRVTGIERYVSETRINGQRSKQTYYRPVVVYVYNGEEKTVRGMGFNEIRHKLEQTVPVLLNVSEDGTQTRAMVDDAMSSFVGACFALMGLGALGVYAFLIKGPLVAALGTAAVFFGAGYVISTAFLKFKSVILQVRDVEPNDKDTELIDTPEAYRKEVSSHGFWAAIISFGFMFATVGMLWLSYDNLPRATRKLIESDFGLFWEKLNAGERLASPEDWILVGISTFFFLASFRSVYYVRKKYGALLVR